MGFGGEHLEFKGNGPRPRFSIHQAEAVELDNHRDEPRLPEEETHRQPLVPLCWQGRASQHPSHLHGAAEDDGNLARERATGVRKRQGRVVPITAVRTADVQGRLDPG